jgi:hypothetical protein
VRQARARPETLPSSAAWIIGWSIEATAWLAITQRADAADAPNDTYEACYRCGTFIPQELLPLGEECQACRAWALATGDP